MVLIHQEGKPRLNPIYVDAANGVGAPKVEELAQHIGRDYLEIILINNDYTTQGKLNYQVKYSPILKL